MRRALAGWVVFAMAAMTAGAWWLPGCRPGSGQQPVEVYVPFGLDSGPAEGDANIPEAGLGLGEVDRDGHPLVTLMLVPASLQDEYNEQATFEPYVPRVLQDALEARLVALDKLTVGDAGPDPVDWPIPDGGTHPLLPMVVGDALLVDTALPCTGPDGGYVTSYLDIENEIYLGGPTHTTCGGRTPREDVVDETLNLLVYGTDAGSRPPITQGVPGPTKPPTTTFPYLAAPN
jgi:hypothetical protein